MTVSTKDTTALSDAELAEMADLCVDREPNFDIGFLSKQREDWVCLLYTSQREVDAKRKAIEAEKQRKIREIERRNQEELKRQERRDAEERKRLEALERKMHSKPYADDPEFLEELRRLLLETRSATNDDIVVMESEADEMLRCV